MTPPAESQISSLAQQAAAAFAAYQDGDRTRMAELVDTVSPVLWRIARSYRLQPESAEDVVQNSWFALVRHAASVADPSAVLSWLIVTTRREAWRVAARAGRDQPIEPEHMDLADTRAELPEQAALRSVRDQALWRHVGALPERCRRLLSVIAFAERPDYAGIAAALGMPIGSIGPTRGRCLAQLRAALAGDPGWSS
jgi:RNA polymerase sigma factor (sigma-70 family)